METIVIRGDGSKEGPAVVDKLLTTSQARQERGRVEIDSRCSSRISREVTSLNSSWLPPGTFVEINDVEKGRVPGIVTGFSINLSSSGDVSRVLRIETEDV